ncbi:MAG: hypothetical protein SPJ11_06675 [Coprococcus catus]|nr:hypothetical protein [Coprococcus catus]
MKEKALFQMPRFLGGASIANGIFTGTVIYRSGASLEASLIEDVFK